jgi:hypothetical protein
MKDGRTPITRPVRAVLFDINIDVALRHQE